MNILSVTLVKEMWDLGIKKRLKNEILIFDGAMGTMLQNKGLKLGEIPETLNIKSKDTIIEIHKSYIEAGADIITTNTFGANELKLKNSEYTVEEVIHHAVLNAKKATKNKDVYIGLDIGPIGELLEPMGTLKFEEAYNIFKRQVLQGVKDKVDLFVIETMTDLYETKAAILAVKENSNIPVFCTMSFESNGRTFTGCTPESMVMTIQGLGVDALGINCSLGPKEIEPILEKIIKYSKIPVMVQANAGLPTFIDNKTIYNVSPKEFADFGKKFIEKGVRILGGCCGTTNKHIEELVAKIKYEKPRFVDIKSYSGVCTPTNSVFIDTVKVVGERINPTGKELFKDALKSGNIDFILKEAIVQVESGADILDVNVGLPEIDEENTMIKVIKEIQSLLDIPLQIDSTNPRAIESGLRVYNGKAIVNSVNGEDKVLNTILPIVKKYGASVIGLTLDEKGIPSSAVERYRIAEKIVNTAKRYGICNEDIYIDCLTLTAAAQQEDVKETLKALSLVKEKLGVKTVLGVSNVSFGLPNRESINQVFFASALYEGLDLPIINPLDRDMMDTILISNLLWNKDKGGKEYISHNEAKSIKSNRKKDIAKTKLSLWEIINKGMKEEAKNATSKLLLEKDPLAIINEYLVPALDLVGERYEKGEIFLPQLIQSAETVKNAFEVLKKGISTNKKMGITGHKILIATVKGDVHDIGKNIVKILLENYNYDVIDLGKNTEIERIVTEVKNKNIKLVGLSALMTTTVKSMEETILEIKKVSPNTKIMVGGAVLNEEYAHMINADYYAKDAREAVKIARKVFGGNNEL